MGKTTINTEVEINNFPTTSDFISNLKRTHQLIISAAMPVVGTQSTFRKNLIKPILNGNDNYAASVSMIKSVGTDLSIDYAITAPTGTKMVSFKDSFKKLDDISYVLDYIIDKIK